MQSFFEGATTVIPMVHPGIDFSTFPVLGKVLSHGYLATGIIPDKIALPALTHILLGSGVTVPLNILMETFVDYISTAEQSLLRSALETTTSSFPTNILRQLITLLTRFGCRTIPTPSSLREMVRNVAVYEFCVKPLAAITLMNTGIHNGFWSTKTPNDIQKIHITLTATPIKVLSMLDFPDTVNPAEDRVVVFLNTMIGNMANHEDLRNFLCFVTGASVCV